MALVGVVSIVFGTDSPLPIKLKYSSDLKYARVYNEIRVSYSSFKEEAFIYFVE